MIANNDGRTIASAVLLLIALFAAGACENLSVYGICKLVAFILMRSLSNLRVRSRITKLTFVDCNNTFTLNDQRLNLHVLRAQVWSLAGNFEVHTRDFLT